MCMHWCSPEPDGIDELGVDGPADCYEVTPDGVRQWILDPADAGIEIALLDAVRGGDAVTNAAIIVDVLDGAARSAPRRCAAQCGGCARRWRPRHNVA